MMAKQEFMEYIKRGRRLHLWSIIPSNFPAKEFREGYLISTAEIPPIGKNRYETMVFKIKVNWKSGDSIIIVWDNPFEINRYETIDQALTGHWTTVLKWLKKVGCEVMFNDI